MSNQQSAAQATHVIQSPLTPTATPDRREYLTMTESDRRTDREVRFEDLDIRFDNIQVRADFQGQTKKVFIRFDLLHQRQTLKYEMSGVFNEEGLAILDILPNSYPEHQRYFRATARCVQQCGQVIVDLSFRSQTREFHTQYESELHQDFRSARSSVTPQSGGAPSTPSPAENLPDQADGEGEGSDPSELPGQWTRPPESYAPGFLQSISPLVRDEDLNREQSSGLAPAPNATPPVTPEPEPAESTPSAPEQVDPVSPSAVPAPLPPMTPSTILDSSKTELPSSELEEEPDDGSEEAPAPQTGASPQQVQPAPQSEASPAAPVQQGPSALEQRLRENAASMQRAHDARAQEMEAARIAAHREAAARREQEKMEREIVENQQRLAAQERVRQMADEQARQMAQRQEALRRAHAAEAERRRLSEEEKARALEQQETQAREAAEARAAAQRAREEEYAARQDLEDLERGRIMLARMAELDRQQAEARRQQAADARRQAQEQADFQKYLQGLDRLDAERERAYQEFTRANRRRFERERQRFEREEKARRGMLPEQQRRHAELQRLRIQQERQDEAQYQRDLNLPLPPAYVPPPPEPERPQAPAQPTRPSVPTQQQGGFQSPQVVIVGFIQKVWTDTCNDLASRFPLFPCSQLGANYRGKSEGYYGMPAGCRGNYCWSEQRGNLMSGTAFGNSPSYRQLTRRTYGSGLTALFMEALGRQIQQEINNRTDTGDISAQLGGKISPHKSHQNGLDIDLYTFKINNRTFDAARNWQLLKMIDGYGIAHRIYTSRENKREICREAKRLNQLESHASLLQRLVFVQNHTLHFHIRLQCTPHNGQTCRGDGSRLSADELCSSRHYNVR